MHNSLGKSVKEQWKNELLFGSNDDNEKSNAGSGAGRDSNDEGIYLFRVIDALIEGIQEGV